MNPPRAHTAKSTRRPLIVQTPIGNASEVSINFFASRLLPLFHPDLDLDELTDRGAFRNAITMQGRLWGYSKKSPSGIYRTDVKNVFTALWRGIHLIVKAIDVIEPTFIFYNNEDSESVYEERAGDSLPDAFFLPVKSTLDSVQWTEVAVSGEYKREDSEDNIRDNIKKVSQSMLNSMRDPRRRSTYGFTVEDANMKLWYCDRSQIVVSEPFNIIEDYRMFIWFVLSVTFAEPCDLGWDPTMAVVNQDSGTQYDISVRSATGESVTYRTLELLSDASTRPVLSRGTQIWKAIRLVDGKETGDPVALKDVWVDNSREREGDINARARQAKYLPTEDISLEEYLLAVERHGDVFVGGNQDRTPTLFKTSSSSACRSQLGETSATNHETSDKLIDTILPFQIHSRIVFKEVGIPLRQVTSLRAVFQALADAIYGLIAMHQSGWVHRDISPGNIIIVNGKGKITDLEFAAKMDEQHEAGKTGTPGFIAVEVYAQRYLFQPNTTSSVPDLHSILEELTKNGKNLNKENMPLLESLLRPVKAPSPRFRYNPLHDLESLWWIAVHFVVSRDIKLDEAEAADDSVDRVASQRDFASSIFRSDSCRDAVMTGSDFFKGGLSTLHPRLTEVAGFLEDARLALRQSYVDAEQPESIEHIDGKVAGRLYLVFLHVFRAVADHLEARDINICRFSDSARRY